MKTARKIFAACLLLLVLLALGLWWEIAGDRRRAERAVTTTVENIARLEPRALDLASLSNAAVAPARVQVLGTNPVLFNVHAITAWPDVMIYEYDSRAPERGVYHYLF